MHRFVRRLPQVGVALASSLFLLALGLLPGLVGLPGVPGAGQAIPVHASNTVYVCGYNDAQPNRSGGWRYWQGTGPDPCADSGTHCSGGQLQCWVNADVHVYQGDTVDWENGTGGHSLVITDATPNNVGWPNSSPDGPPGATEVFPSNATLGVYHYHCAYHQNMTGTVTVAQAPPTPSPVAQPTPTVAPTDITPIVDSPSPDQTSTSSGGGGGGHRPGGTRPGSSPAATPSGPSTATSPGNEIAQAPASASPGGASPPPNAGGSGGNPPASGHGSNEPFGVANFWVVATLGVLAIGAVMVALGTVMLVRAGRPHSVEPEE